MNEGKRFYEFDGLRFYPDERLLVRLDDGHPFGLTPKVSSLLLVLIERRGEVVAYDEIKREVWRESGQTLDHTLRETKRTLSRTLGDRSHRLETITGKGYRLNADVAEWEGATGSVSGKDPAAGTDTTQTEDGVEATDKVRTPTVPSSRASYQSAPSFGGHRWHMLASCALYALLYVIALLVEVAYAFDRLGGSALRIAPLVFAWVFATSLIGLSVVWGRVRRGRLRGLPLSIIIFFVAGLLLYAALGFFLPHEPVTEANFQTYTAHGAYLKSVAYFLFAAVLFLVIPFHCVVSLQRELEAGSRESVHGLLENAPRATPPDGAIYLRPWWLGLLLLVAAVLSPIMVSHLFENLKPGPRMNLFTQLVEWRVLTYLTLALECFLWYHRRLGEFRRRCAGV